MLTFYCGELLSSHYFFSLEEKQILFGLLTAVEARAESLPPASFFVVVVGFFGGVMFLQVIPIFIRYKTLRLNLVSSVILGLLFFLSFFIYIRSLLS